MDKYTKAHNRMALETGETKTRTKLSKSKHGWVKVAMGITFASTSLLAYSTTANAATNVEATVPASETQSTDITLDDGQATGSTADNGQVTSSAASAQSDAAQSSAAQSSAASEAQSEASDQNQDQEQADEQPAQTTEEKNAQLTNANADEKKAEASVAPKVTTKKASSVNGVAGDDKVNKDEDTDKLIQSVFGDLMNQHAAQTSDAKEEQQPASIATSSSAAAVTSTASASSSASVSQASDQQLSTKMASETNSGTYTTSGEQNVRSTPSLNGAIVGAIEAGQTINYDTTQDADGYTWVHYQNNGGDRWVAKMANTSLSHQEFINSIAPGAIETWNQYGVLPSVSIAQAIVESAWGQAAPGNNLFGIKGSYNGQSTTQATTEYYNGQLVNIYDQFRAYPSYAESVMDHGRFLAVNSRYANLIGSRDYAQVSWMLQNDGYATAPTYANTLINTIQANNLNSYDNGLGNPGQGSNNSNNNSQNVVAANGTWTFGSDVNVRTSPSLSGSIVGYKNAGDKVSYNGLVDNDGYTWMQFNDGAGHVYAAQIGSNADVPSQPSNQNNNQTNNDNQTNNQTTNQNNNGGSYTVTSDYQNVRNGASLSAGITGQLSNGDSIDYDSTNDADGYTWLHYKNYAGVDRWVARMGNATQVQTPSQETNNNNNSNNNNSQPTQTTNNNQAGTQDHSGAYTLSGEQNVRTDSSLSAAVTGQLSAGDTIYYNATRDQDGYTWLRYQNYAGADRWVAQMNAATPTTENHETASNNNQATSNENHSENNGQAVNNQGGTYQVTSDYQNVRTDGSLSAGITGQLSNGDSINYDYTKDADGYTWVHYKNYAGADRWVAKMNDANAVSLNNQKIDTDSAFSSNRAGAYTLSSGAQNVRSGAGLNSSVIGGLSAGETVYYDGSKQADGYTWLHYKDSQGTDCWVADINLTF
ncbi:SH3 domain-containing protein [Fructilactobacillus vespulae]|uniref:SH3 domain-containing protein n=1 Tax=Fructilactobacillus vespulae TaxID=1249630 RepID=UPI0039B5EAE2